MIELPRLDRYFVKKSDKAAMSVMMKLCKNMKPGDVIAVTDDEFEALRHSIIIVADEQLPP